MEKGLAGCIFIWRSCLVMGALLLCMAGIVAAQASLEWVKGVAGPPYAEAWRCKIDRGGYVYTVGRYNSNAVDFDPGPGVFQSPCGNREACFLVKLDSLGGFVWERSFVHPGATGSIFRESEIELDSMGNIYVAMPAEENLDADPGPAVQLLTVNGGDDVALVKIDPAGNFVWGFRMGGTGIDNPYDIDVLPNGDFVVTGQFQYTIDFDPGPGTATFTSASTIGDIFMAKYSSSGALIWVRVLTSTGMQFPGNVALDAQGNSYWSGVFTGSADLDPGAGTQMVTANFLNDIFLIRLDPNGNFTGGVAWATSNSMAPPCDLQMGPGQFPCIYFEVYGTEDLDPGPGTVMSATPVGGSNTAMVCLDQSFNYQWSWAMATQGFNRLDEFAVSPGGCIYFSGAFKGTLDFDPGPAVHTLTAGNNLGTGFICQLDANGNYVDAWTIGGTESSWVLAVDIGPDRKGCAVGECGTVCDFDPGPNVAGHGYGSLLSPFYWKWNAPCAGCSDTTDLTASACQSYVFAGQTLVNSGTYQHTFTTVDNCDSVVVLHLTIDPVTSGTVTVSGCDSVEVNGQYYAASGTYQQVLTNVAGCDSFLAVVVTLQVIDTTVTQQGDSLVAAPGMTAYQWLECENQYIVIPGATAQLFAPPSSGQYAVVVTDGFCTDTSSCHAVVIIGVPDGEGEGMAVAPSPTAGAFAIHLPAGVGACTYRVDDACGRMVLQGKCAGPRADLHLAGPAGMYGVTVQAANGATWHRRVLKL